MQFNYQTTDRIRTKATLGLIVLQPDETIEHDFRRLLPVDNTALYVSRIPSGREVTNDTLAAMKADLPRAAGLFPSNLEFDVVGYGCTSGTSVIGTDAISGLIRQGCHAERVTEPVSGLIAACRTLGISKLGFLSPYIEDVSATLRTTLAKAGLTSPVFGSFNEAVEEKVARIDGPSIVAASARLAAEGGIDGLFLSCTNLRTLDVINEIEDQTGLPVLSSNLVLAWHMARLTNLPLIGNFGRLCRQA